MIKCNFILLGGNSKIKKSSNRKRRKSNEHKETEGEHERMFHGKKLSELSDEERAQLKALVRKERAQRSGNLRKSGFKQLD